MEYNYVIFGSDWDLYLQSYADVMNREDVRYISGYKQGKSKWILPLYCIHNSEISRKKIKLPFRGLWNPTYFINDFKDEKPLCFVYTRAWLDFEHYGLVDYLKKEYPNSKHTLFFQDLYRWSPMHDRTQEQYADHLKSVFDLIISFDQGDCEKHGFIYHPLVFSSFHGKLWDIPESDVYFLGRAKDRFKDIILCCEKFWENELTTDIYIVNQNQERIYEDRIHYIDKMPYLENLQHALHSKCELEIMQTGGHGYTQRMCEVISLDKRLVTNNPTVHEAPFYTPDCICQIKTPADITPDFCQRIKKGAPVNYNYKENLSPIELLQFIKKHLS